MRTLDLDTPHGLARAHLQLVAEPRAVLVLGHGAGGGVAAPDLVAATRVATALGVGVALVEQPYRVAGRRSAAPARQLDVAWTVVVEQLLRTDELRGCALVAGGRSSGARVACRTAAATGAAGVLCLAFPLQPPPRRSGSVSPSRLPELEGVDVPMLIVQGDGDPFGVPAPRPRRTVVVVRGNHSLRSDMPAVSAAITDWLPAIVA